MEASQGPPPVRPRPPGEEPEAAREHGRLRTWLAVVGVIAIAAAGLGGYALSEATKEEEKPDDAPLRSLRVDVRALETELKARLDQAEAQLKEASAAAGGLQKLRKETDSLDKRVTALDKESDDGDDLATRIDDLEQRVEDLEQDSGSGD